MTGTKKWYNSKAVWGGIVALVSLLASVVAGVEIGEQEQREIVEIVMKAVAVIGSFVAIYGRIVASKRIQ